MDASLRKAQGDCPAALRSSNFERDSSNACLNVKFIVKIHFEYEQELEQPVFGSKLPGSPKVCKNQE